MSSVFQHQLTLVAPLHHQAERPQDANHVFSRLERGNEDQIRAGVILGLFGGAGVGKARVHPLVNRPHDPWFHVESVNEVAGRGVRDGNQSVGVIQGARQVALESCKSFPGNRARHRDEGEIVNRRHLGRSERLLVGVEEKVGREDHPVAVEDSQHRLNERAQDRKSRSHRQQKPGRDLVDAHPHAAAAREAWRGGIIRCEKGPGVQVVTEPVVASVESGQQVPRVPADTSHAFEKRIHIDPDRSHGFMANSAGLEAAPACPEGPKNVTGDRTEKPGRGGDAVEHDRRSYTNTESGAGTDAGAGRG
jgi:hypothetical protein